MKTILITGAGSGFGKGTAFELSRRGYKVIAGVQIPPQKTKLLEEAKAEGIELDVIILDITNEDQRQVAFKYDIDVLINNAGIAEAGPIAEIPLKNVRNNFETNVFGTVAMIQGFVPQMIKKAKGKIITVTSTAGLMTVPVVSVYSATKHALESLMEGLKVELLGTGIEVCTVLPGAYNTGFNDRAGDAMQTWFDPEKTFVKPETFAELELLLENQLDPQSQIDDLVRIAEEENSKFRNVCPEEMIPWLKSLQERSWDVRQDEAIWLSPFKK